MGNTKSGVKNRRLASGAARMQAVNSDWGTVDDGGENSAEEHQRFSGLAFYPVPCRLSLARMPVATPGTTSGRSRS